MKNKFTTIIIVMMCMLMVFLTACTHNNADNLMSGEIETSPIGVNTFTIPEANDSGGYEIITDTFHCIVVADGEYKYSCFESYSADRKVEFYAGPTAMVIVDISDGVATYYTEQYDDVDQLYTNPIKYVYDDLRNLEFLYIDCVEEGGVNYEVYEAEQVIESIKQNQIRYNMYSVEMDWVDGLHYSYKYYDYADGSTLISAEAPDEINPRLDENTKWVVDLDNLRIYNQDTEESVAIVITNISIGEGLSPDGNETEVVTHSQKIRIYVDKDASNISRLKYVTSENGTDINIVNDVNIKMPNITTDMVEMDDETVQLTFMLIMMLDSLI